MNGSGAIKTKAAAFAAALFLVLHPSASAQSPNGQLIQADVPDIKELARKAGLSNLQISTRVASPGRIVVDGFSAGLGEGTVQGKGLVELSQPARQHRMRVTVSGVDAEALLRFLDVDLEASVKGAIDGELDLTWTGLKGPEVQRTLAGPVRMRAGEGSVSNADMLNQAVEASGVDELKTFSFTSAQGAGVFRNGRFDVENLTIGGETEEVRGRGAIQLPNEQVAIRLDIYLDPSVAASSARANVRAVGQRSTASDEKKGSVSGRKIYPAAQQLVRIPVAVAVTGPLEDPKFTFANQ